MDLYAEIIKIYPELTINDFDIDNGKIKLRDDGDGNQYIAKWEHELPLPKGMKIGK